jgi:hypothetical protein
MLPRRTSAAAVFPEASTQRRLRGFKTYPAGQYIYFGYIKKDNIIRMGSNRTLRHRHGIQHLSHYMHQLFCSLTRSMRQIRDLCADDILLLDQNHSWATLSDKSITLPPGLTMEAVNIVFAIHRCMGDIIAAYDEIQHRPPHLMDFFEDLLNKYCDLIEEDVGCPD